ncbi:hypothetical protein HMPREF9140_00332 [Prevotella micans F0438]|uniref:Amine oxidase domain-containing protein n=1 Tax=Prevotella micans F0438 TaxID=883158 RepID=H1Q094_9BACT|nr:NAD(P)/FAD-dependent oxidoreductase [Prevotella micans]EHO74171.1 hypothetical protein HMPREF9140_00332 [Prevotella micans F0438]
MNQDVIIIGGGLGGLFTGALLAHEGLVVKVLEKNATIGGGLQTFRRGNVEFETGMHILGGFREGGTLRRICSHLGIMENLAIRHLDADCMDEITCASDGKTYRIASGRNAFVQSLAEHFPHQQSKLHEYVDALYNIANEVDAFYLRPSSTGLPQHSEHFLWSADELISHYISDPRLRNLLAYMNPMYGGVKGKTPAYIHALINVLYIDGPSRFEGGSLQLAEALKDVIIRAGGEVVGNAPVESIEVAEHKVQRVVTIDGTVHTAQKYIAAIHPSELFRIITPGAFPKAYQNRLKNIPNTYSAFTLFIEFRDETFPYINHTCYYERDYDNIWNLAQYDEASWPAGFMYMTPATAKQGSFASHMIINCIMPYQAVEQWADTRTGRRGVEYETWKAARCEDIICLMEKCYPNFRPALKRVHAASPLTVRDYFHTPNGSLYGYAKDCHNIILTQVPVVTKIPNLLLTGQNVGLHGICGVPLSAITTAEAIVGANKIVNQMQP